MTGAGEIREGFSEEGTLELEGWFFDKEAKRFPFLRRPTQRMCEGVGQAALADLWALRGVQCQGQHLVPY